MRRLISFLLGSILIIGALPNTLAAGWNNIGQVNLNHQLFTESSPNAVGTVEIERDFQWALMWEPNRVSTLRAFGFFKLLQGEDADAEQLCYRAILLNHLNLLAHICRADAAEAMGDWNTAAEEWQSLNAGGLLLYRAEQLIKVGEFARAEKYLLIIQASDPSFAESRYTLGIFYWQTNRLLEARSVLEDALDASVKCCTGLDRRAAIMESLANVLYSLQQWDDAIDMYHKLEKIGYSEEATLGIARVLYWGKGESEEGLSILQDAIKNNPDWMQSYIMIGEIYMSQGQYAEADGWFDQGLKRNPTFNGLWMYKGINSYHQGQLPTAEFYLKEAMILDSNNGYNQYIYYWLAKVYEEMGRLNDAERSTVMAITRSPNNIEFHLELAKLYILTNRADEARAEYRLILSLDPTNLDAINYMSGK